MFEAGYDVHSLQDHFSYEFEPGIGEISIFEVMPVMMKGFSDSAPLRFLPWLGPHHTRQECPCCTA